MYRYDVYMMQKLRTLCRVEVHIESKEGNKGNRQKAIVKRKL